MSLSFLQFTSASTDLSQVCEPSYDPLLVAISFSVAVLAALTALRLADRLQSAASPRARGAWIASGALSLGSGIWAMHFIAVLAMTLPIPIHFDLSLTLLSPLPAILGSAVALHVLGRPEPPFWRLNGAGLLLGLGVGSMHYAGMAAMVLDAEMRFDPMLFIGSILIAHILSTLALYTRFGLRARLSAHAYVTHLASGLVMSAMIAAMHYTGMAATYFLPLQVPRLGPLGGTDLLLSPTGLSVAIAIATALLLMLAIASTVIDERLSQIAQALATSQQRAADMVEAIGEGLFGIDAEGRTTFMNPAAALMLGWQVEEALGLPSHALLHHSRRSGEPYPEEECPICESARAGGVHRCSEEVFWRRVGTSFPVEYVSAPLRGPSDQPIGAVVIFRDISRRERLEAQLRQAQKLESIGQLAAGIAHEINTPVQFVSDNIHFLGDSFEELDGMFKSHEVLLAAADAIPELSGSVANARQAWIEADMEFIREEIPKAIDQSRDGVARIAKIVRAMKDFAHPGVEVRTPTDLNQAIESTVTVARNEWKYVAEVETTLASDLPEIPCLADAFRQALLNLIVNAAQAIGEEVERGEKTGGNIEVRTFLHADCVQIDVTDDGPGIPEDIRARIFDPFFTTKEVGKGTGQGLAITHSAIVERMGGTLELVSEVGMGTTFSIRLPLANADSVTPEPR